MPCFAVLSYPVLSHPTLSYPILSYPILSYPILSYPILSYPILSYPILSCPILSYPILSCHILPYFVICYLILSYPIQFCLVCHVLSCPVRIVLSSSIPSLRQYLYSPFPMYHINFPTTIIKKIFSLLILIRDFYLLSCFVVTQVRWMGDSPSRSSGASDRYLISLGGDDKCIFQWYENASSILDNCENDISIVDFCFSLLAWIILISSWLEFFFYHSLFLFSCLCLLSSLYHWKSLTLFEHYWKLVWCVLVKYIIFVQHLYSFKWNMWYFN